MKDIQEQHWGQGATLDRYPHLASPVKGEEQFRIYAELC